MADFWKEIEKGYKCITLATQLLKEREKTSKYLKERGLDTRHAEFEIARLKYALGEISIAPDPKDYFYTERTHNAKNDDYEDWLNDD